MSKKWFDEGGKDYDVAVSTRVRFARNVEGYRFPNKMSAQEKSELIEKIRKAVCEGNFTLSSSIRYIDMSSLSETEKVSMVERHLISPDYASDSSGRGLLITDDESLSLMLCEEDHIRLQVMNSGLEPDKTYDMARKVASVLEESLKFSFKSEYGYLTACPTNLGTAMRASVMMHLPALEQSGALSGIAKQLGKMGMTVRGVYGEGTRSVASMYQISNQTTMGISETDTIARLKDVCATIIEAERKTRKEMLSRVGAQDKLWRAFGALKYSRMLSSEEFAPLFSLLRLGASQGIFGDMTAESLAGLFEMSQPATLSLILNGAAAPAERDERRAAQIRAVLEKY